jgi:hypothetical protein
VPRDMGISRSSQVSRRNSCMPFLLKLQGVLRLLDEIFNLDSTKVKELVRLRSTFKSPASTKKRSKGLAPPPRSMHFPSPIATPQDSPPDSPLLIQKKREGPVVRIKHDRLNRGVLENLFAYKHCSEAPGQVIDNHGNSVMHWACALGHVQYLASLARLPIKLVNTRRQSPLAFAITRQDNYERQTFAALQPFYGVQSRDICGRNFLHSIVAQGNGRLASMYYLECIADWIDTSRDSRTNETAIKTLLDAQVCLSFLTL